MDNAAEKIIKVGPAGRFPPAADHECWDEKGRSELFEIYISHGDWIHSIQFQYVENGEVVMSEQHGECNGPKFDVVQFEYPMEFLTGISGDCLTGLHLTSLALFTNKRIYGPYGHPSASRSRAFHFQLGNSRRFAGFYGYNSKVQQSHRLEAIGVYFKPTTRQAPRPQEDEYQTLPPVEYSGASIGGEKVPTAQMRPPSGNIIWPVEKKGPEDQYQALPGNADNASSGERVPSAYPQPPAGYAEDRYRALPYNQLLRFENFKELIPSKIPQAGPGGDLENQYHAFPGP